MGIKTKEMKVLTIDQMHQLKELGVDVKPKGTCLMYTSDSSDNYYLKYGESTCEDDIKAFGLQDIIELLPPQLIHKEKNIYLNFENIGKEYGFYYVDCDFEIYIYFNNTNILQAAYKMLLWVIENGYLKTK